MPYETAADHRDHELMGPLSDCPDELASLWASSRRSSVTFSLELCGGGRRAPRTNGGDTAREHGRRPRGLDARGASQRAGARKGKNGGEAQDGRGVRKKTGSRSFNASSKSYRSSGPFFFGAELCPWCGFLVGTDFFAGVAFFADVIVLDLAGLLGDRETSPPKPLRSTTESSAPKSFGT